MNIGKPFAAGEDGAMNDGNGSQTAKVDADDTELVDDLVDEELDRQSVEGMTRHQEKEEDRWSRISHPLQ